jgi:amino acid transporter
MTETTHHPHLRRRINLRQAIALNMGQMCGVGPFITIPVMVVAFGGPQAILGWIFGALLALCDGLVWAELGAAMPGSGGTYVYLREAFQYRSGRLMPFLFVWEGACCWRVRSTRCADRPRQVGLSCSRWCCRSLRRRSSYRRGASWCRR